jgi:DNA-binding CsgD family transcriptional regulator
MSIVRGFEPNQSSPAGRDLVGREGELARLSAWVEDLAAGRGRVALVEGEPGIGKSALLRAGWELAAAAGCAVFRGAGEQLGQAFPLLPLLDALAVRASSPDPPRAAVLAALRGRDADTAAAAAEALLALVDRLCAHAPAALVLDDLHWADTTTLSVCRQLASTAAQRPLLLIAATRPLPRRPEVKTLRRAVKDAPEGTLMRLEPLPPQAAADLVARLAGGRPGPRLAALAAGAAGNPLYLTELVEALSRAEAMAVRAGTAEATGAGAPATLTEAIIDRLDFLPPPARRLLHAAALLGAEFTIDDLAAVTGRPPAELAAPLADARAGGVLADTGAGLAFRHPLIRTAVYHDLPASARHAWHHDAARALHHAGAPAGQIARQLLPTLPSGADPAAAPLPGWAIDWLAHAAPELAGEASAVAVALLRAALARLPAAEARRHLLASHLATALGYQNDNHGVEELASQTLPHVTDPDILVALTDALARARGARLERVPETLAAIDQAQASAGLTPRARNRLQVIAARVHHLNNDFDRAERVAGPALAEALASGDPWAVTWSANIIAIVRADRGDPLGALEPSAQGLAATEGEPALIDARVMLLANRAEILLRLDRLAEARAALTAARTLAERTGKTRRLAWIQSSLCGLAYEAGRWDDALADADLPDGDYPLSAATTQTVAALILMRRRQMAAGRRHLTAARAACERLGFPAPLSVLADALERETDGDPAGALTVLTTAFALADATRPAHAETWLPDIARLALRQGDRQAAADAAHRADQLNTAGSAPRRDAAAAHCHGLLDSDPALLLRAADGYAQAGRPLPRAQALEAAAAALAERGQRPAARAPLTAACDIYTELGAEWDLTRLRANFRAHGMRPPARRTPRPATGWDALTPAQATIAHLAAGGLSNPEIAEQLMISRHTVKTHLTQAMAKLHARSRADLARAAADHAQR